MDASRSPCLLGYDNNERRLWDFRFADRLRVIAEDRATTNELQIVSFPAANDLQRHVPRSEWAHMWRMPRVPFCNELRPDGTDLHTCIAA
jgi:hypothetical protein